MDSADPKASSLDVPLERDGFTRSLIRELAGTLEDVVGLEDASGYISVVGTAIGEQIDQTYKTAFAVEKLSREQVADVLVDLKRRIRGRLLHHRGGGGSHRPGKPHLSLRRKGPRPALPVHDDFQRVWPCGRAEPRIRRRGSGTDNRQRPLRLQSCGLPPTER